MKKKWIIVSMVAAALILLGVTLLNLCPAAESWLHDVTGWH